MSTRKHVTELAFGLASQGVLLLHPKDVDRLAAEASQEIRDLAAECHIYLITKRPRLGYVTDSIVAADGLFRGRMYYRHLGERIEVGFAFAGNPTDAIIYGEYPHGTISIDTPRGMAGPFPAYLVSLICDEIDDAALRHLEVVYVGMSFGDGTRSAADRLRSHSTLQQVLADLSSDDPDSECLLVLVQYAPPFIAISIDARDRSLDPDNDRDPVDDIERQQRLMTLQEEVALAEAALIRYFSPLYNEKYKNTFPERSHSITKSLYDIDFGGLTVELNTEDINVRLYSERRAPGYHHVAAFDLHDPSIRRSFFNLVEPFSREAANVVSGPLF